MKDFFSYIIKNVFIFIFFTSLFKANFAIADDFVLDDEQIEGNSSLEYIIDTENEAGAGDFIQLQFGETLAETLQWSIDNSRFEFSDSVRIEGNQATVGQTFIADDHDSLDSDGFLNLGRNGGVFESITWDDSEDSFVFSDDIDLVLGELIAARIENLAVEPVCDAGSTGRLYFNTVSTETFVCNGAEFRRIDGESTSVGTGQLSAAQGRRTTPFAVPVAFADVSLDTTDIENDLGVINHDGADRITVLEDGIYRVTYNVSFNNPTAAFPTIEGRVRVNDATILPGSEITTANFQTGGLTNQTHASQSILAQLSAGDFLTLQLQSSAALNTINDITMNVFRMDGVTALPKEEFFAQFYESGTTTIPTTSTVIDFDGADAAVRIVDPVFTHNTGVNPSEIGVTIDGIYEISYNISWDTTANARRNITCQVLINGVAPATPVGVSQGYARNTTDDLETNSATFIRSLNAGDVYEVECDSTGSNGSAETLANQSMTLIKLLRRQ